MLTYSQKQSQVKEIKERVDIAKSMLVADYRGVTVSEMTLLRKKAREGNVELKVVKNTLLKRIVEGTQYESMKPCFKGLSLLAISVEEPGAAAKLFVDFIKDCENMEVKGLSLGADLIPSDQLKKIAALPTRLQALASLAGLVKMPITHLVYGLKDAPARLVRVLHAHKEAMASS